MWILLSPLFFDIFALFLSCIDFLSTLTGSEWLSLDILSQSLFLHMFFLIIILYRKWLLSILTFIMLYIFALILLICPLNLNPSVTDKALNKFKNPKCSVCHTEPCLSPIDLLFYSSIFSKFLKSFQGLSFKVTFKPVKTIKFYWKVLTFNFVMLC